jgi:hypothetical protein
MVVIELRNGADWLPSVRRVTVLAGNIQIAVWAVCPGCLRLRVARACGKHQQQHSDEIEYAPRRPHDSPLALAQLHQEKNAREFNDE